MTHILVLCSFIVFAVKNDCSLSSCGQNEKCIDGIDTFSCICIDGISCGTVKQGT